MKSTIEELGPTRVRMAIEVPWGDLDHAFGEVYKELGKQVRVPGFRPGKVPNRVLDQRLGRPVVLEQVVQHAVPEIYSEVIRENQVRVLGQPDIEVTRLDDNDTLAFTAEVDVAPQLELPALDSLAVTVDDVEVTDEEIDQQISVMRERFGMLTGVERAAQDGDFVSIDLEAKLDGEVLEDGSTTGMSYEVGSGNLMEGLDDAVRGLSADESKTFQTALLSGPDAGQLADVTVTVRSVKEKELPELDDEFAQTASEFDTLEELREDARTRLARTKVIQQGAQARDKLVEHLIETIEVPVPENLVEREVQWRNQAFERELAQAGMDWDAFLQMSGVESREDYEADQRTNVEQAVKTQFILDAIADAREVTVGNDDLSAQIMAQAQRNRMSPEQFAQQLQQSGNIAEFVADVRRTKTLAQLLEQTTITDESGRTVDLDALRPKTVQAAAEETPAGDTEEAPVEAEEIGVQAVATEAAEGATEDTEDVTKA
ncbi:trigger factor [Blastococcus sp. MG754426]|uniref:trigger factor n=1 Tax=unclassified Blastococcus TaxID=2619396 RepID=UPI001EF114E4|nr:MULTISPECIES: trigger factor [unclassified Blastococcus]MCF6506666.1 trigger factor [Blastococcus sp. MG754426]MCF6511478.1 trigger factor [Blastococcus sp. MG754427]MCF6734863.1 trigger factor [Blastococcus sp. KM273129]